MAEAVKEKEKLERKSSKSRLSKQDEVEEVEEDNDNSPSSEASDATVIPAGKNDIQEWPEIRIYLKIGASSSCP